MDEPLEAELRHRIQVLERENRRWKFIGFTTLTALGVLLVLGGVLMMGAWGLTRAGLARAQEEAMMERDQAEMMRQQAEQERLRAVEAKQKFEEELAKTK